MTIYIISKLPQWVPLPLKIIHLMSERLKLYKHTNGTCNASGPAIRALREKAGISQEQLAAKLQLAGLNLNQKAVSRIETGDRVVPDFELNYFATVLDVPVCTLLEYEK